jgi:uncharacterized protein YnzC (UPF0291/DUF896 family)
MKQLETKDGVLQNNNEKQKHLQSNIDDLTKTEKANHRTVQELREKQKQVQSNIDDVTKNVKTLNQTVQLLCEHPKDVSIRKLSQPVNGLKFLRL